MLLKYTVEDFPAISAILRLATKYGVDPLRTSILQKLEEYWPVTLGRWDQRERKATDSAGLYRPRSFYPHPMCVISLNERGMVANCDTFGEASSSTSLVKSTPLVCYLRLSMIFLVTFQVKQLLVIQILWTLLFTNLDQKTSSPLSKAKNVPLASCPHSSWMKWRGGTFPTFVQKRLKTNLATEVAVGLHSSL